MYLTKLRDTHTDTTKLYNFSVINNAYPFMNLKRTTFINRICKEIKKKRKMAFRCFRET